MKMKRMSMPAREDMLGMALKMVEMIFRSWGHDRASLRMRRSRHDRSTERELLPLDGMESSMSEMITELEGH